MPSRTLRQPVIIGMSGGETARIGGLVMEVLVPVEWINFRLIRAFDGET